MKIFYFLIPLFLVNACKTQSGNVISSETNNMEKFEKSASDCPKGATCTVVIHKNKQLNIVDDGSGSFYPEIIDGKNLVVEYTFLKAGPDGTADGNYFENISFEIPAQAENLVKENSALSDVKMVFSKHGNRLGAYYKVTQGKLLFSKAGNSATIDLRFKVDNSSQVISRIKETVNL